MHTRVDPIVPAEAECSRLVPLLEQVGAQLEDFLKFEHPDALQSDCDWQALLQGDLPREGQGADAVVAELNRLVIPHGSAMVRPGCTSFITTGAANIGALANLAANIASPQRGGLTAFNLLEELTLDWLARLFQLGDMKGVYSSGGSSANIIALGAARQAAFESLGLDVAELGVNRPVRIYASAACHRTIQRAAAVLGCGRQSVRLVETDASGRMNPRALQQALQEDASGPLVKMAVVANAGATSTGAIDPLEEIGSIARDQGLWFHVDGAYGLPGILDPEIRHLYQGLELADSVIVDPHKWLGAPVGIGATFVRDRNLLFRAFNQGESDYLEGSMMVDDTAQSSLDSFGIPYFDFSLELSSPPRGVVVWALLKEIGEQGLRARIVRHNAMAKQVASRARAHPQLELLQEPTLSICCFRFVDARIGDLNAFNRRIHRRLVRNNRNIPSTAMINGQLAIRPCFVGARTHWQHADDLVDEVLEIGTALLQGDQNHG